MRSSLIRGVCLVAGGLAAAGAPALAQAHAPADLASLQASFEKQMKRIEGDATDKLLAWPARYTKAVAALQKKLQAAGDLEGWQATDEELKRFKTDNQLAGRDLADHPEVRAVQEQYVTLPERLIRDRDARIVSLRDRYVRRLSPLQKKLTVAGRMQDALMVTEEIKRVDALPLVAAAVAAARADEESARAASASAPQPAAEARAESGGPEAAAAAIPKVTMPAGAKFYDGLNAPGVQDYTFKSLSLSGTDRMKVSRNISAAAALGKKADVSRSVRSGYYRYEEKTTAVDYILRVGLRPGGTDAVIENAVLVAQYFGKKMGRTAGKVAPQQLDVQVMPLPKIDAAHFVTVDCPPTSTYGESYQARSYRYRYTYDYGSELYGVIVSVFDADGKLLYQGASNNTLEKMGLAEFPMNYLKEQERRREMERRRSRVGIVPAPSAPARSDESRESSP